MEIKKMVFFDHSLFFFFFGNSKKNIDKNENFNIINNKKLLFL